MRLRKKESRDQAIAGLIDAIRELMRPPEIKVHRRIHCEFSLA